MKRVSFNGGEVSPELALRADLEVFHRSASKLENFDVSQMGGIRRRKGFRRFTVAQAQSRLFSYIYSVDDCYVVEMGLTKLRVYDKAATLVFESDVQYSDLSQIRTRQINSLLIITCPNRPVMELSSDSDSVWTYQAYEFEFLPWRYNEARDYEIKLEVAFDDKRKLSFDADESALESRCVPGDSLRFSHWTMSTDLFAKANVVLDGVQTVDLISPSSQFSIGDKLALREEKSLQYFSCVKDWTGTNVFAAGLSSPLNYPDCFVEAESLEGWDDVVPIIELTSSRSYKRGAKIAIESGYWEYFSCIKDYNAENHVAGATKLSDYPGHFIRGLAIGEAAACRGTWQFYCSGSWVGQYDVRRCFDSADLNEEWESLSNSYSRIGAPSNELLTGDESEEACYLRLFILRSKYAGASQLSGYPADSCSNRLVVSSYKHHAVLRYSCTHDDNGEVVNEEWQDVTPIKQAISGAITSYDWSWQAFSDKYGYPLLCEVYNQRLVLASTAAQGQSIWMSKVDDLSNFAIGDRDSAALALTMATTSQSPMCWLMAQSSRLLVGTADAEWVISSGGEAAITPSNARANNHGYVGSQSVPAIMATDRVLYFERGGGRMHQFGYDFASDSYISRDLTAFAAHILTDGRGVVDGGFQRKPDPRACFVLADGTMALLTYNTLHEVHAWHRYSTDGTFESCCVLPDGTNDDILFCVVTRADGRYIEMLGASETYMDARKYSYRSTMVSTPLASIEGRDQKTPVANFSVYLGGETQMDGIKVSRDGKVWTRLDKRGMQSKGWLSVLAVNEWTYDLSFGVSVEGDRGLHILACQI